MTNHDRSVRARAVLLGALAGVVAGGAATGSGVTERVSLNSADEPGDSDSFSADISEDGRFVAFDSSATNLAPDDGNSVRDVFVRDRMDKTTVRVSVNSAGEEGLLASSGASISADGRYVAFTTESPLHPADTNVLGDVYVHDRMTGATAVVSVDAAGAARGGGSGVISANGQFVAFASTSADLVPGDMNGTSDVFVRDLAGLMTERVSVDSDEVEAEGLSFSPSISGDGRFVSFTSNADNLVENDGNMLSDIFLRDRALGTTIRVNLSSLGAEALGNSITSSLSDDGLFVAFDSSAPNLVGDDGNEINDVFVRDLAAGLTERVSVDSAGAEADGISNFPSLSSDGRYVVFRSFATNLAGLDENGVADAFRHDRATGETIRVSVSTSDEEADGPSSRPAISGDGAAVSFPSTAMNLVNDDPAAFSDIFVHQPTVGACPGDVNGDLVVDFADLNTLLAAFNTTPKDANYNPAADFDGDDDVDFADLNVLVGVFNTVC